jgi:hypothetical protein
MRLGQTACAQRHHRRQRQSFMSRCNFYDRGNIILRQHGRQTHHGDDADPRIGVRSLSPVLPNRWFPAAMENGQNDDTMSFRAEVHAKRESLGDDTANILVNRCVGHRPLRGGGQHIVRLRR